MTLDVYFTPGELVGLDLPDVVVVVDVLRATSTIVEALANGARAVLPVTSADEAARLAQNVGRDSVLLCGERKGLAIEGFDLGNSPAEFEADRVRDKALVMTTTNGTRAFLAVAERRAGKADAPTTRILAGSLLNLGALAARLAGESTPIAIVCAGREGRFALEDAVCAGALAERLVEDAPGRELNDGARAARQFANRCGDDYQAVLASTAAGRHLASIGRAEDLAFCARVDRTDVVPRFRDRKITLE